MAMMKRSLHLLLSFKQSRLSVKLVNEDYRLAFNNEIKSITQIMQVVYLVSSASV